MKKNIIFLLFLFNVFSISYCNAENKNPQPNFKKLEINFIKKKFLNIPYENVKNSENLDLYLPNSGNGPYPLIIGIHGGGFKFGDKTEGINQSMVNATLKGYAVALINYRLSDQSKFPAAIEDVKAAIRFLKANSKKFHINPNKIALWGASSGGNLAALAGTTGNSKVFNNPKLGNSNISTEVQAVIDWFGPINFLNMDNEFKSLNVNGQKHDSIDSFESQYLGKQITTVPNLVALSNPENFITENTPPFLIEHGTGDTNIPYLQSTKFATLLKKKSKNEVKLILLKNAGHGDSSAFDSKENLKVVYDFLDKYLK